MKQVGDSGWISFNIKVGNESSNFIGMYYVVGSVSRAALLWGLPTPSTILSVGSSGDIYHPISICELCTLSSQSCKIRGEVWM
jgi:hypothetical protein